MRIAAENRDDAKSYPKVFRPFISGHLWGDKSLYGSATNFNDAS
jgi:hypothetical protein